MAASSPTSDRAALERLFRQRTGVHVYALADLDEPFWSASRWWLDGQAACGLVAVPEASVGVLYAIADPGDGATLDLVRHVAPDLPDVFFANVAVGAPHALADHYRFDSSGQHRKMVLTGPVPDRPERADKAVTLDRSDLPDLMELFATDPAAGDFFTPPMLDSGLYVGIRAAGRLVAVAGVHVYSERYGVAAIGNVATHPDYRRQGLAKLLTTVLIRRLREGVDVVGLNVHVDNEAAFQCYVGLGFEPVITYVEGRFEKIS